MIAKPKLFSSQSSKRWATTENSSNSRRNPSTALAENELNQSRSSLYPCHLATPPPPRNSHTEYIIFDVINMLYTYNVIFGRDLLNTFKATLHSSYLYLKIPTTFRVIYIFGSQQDAKNIEKGFTPGHKNVHFLREE
jgi:hypothetical protein